MLCQDSSRLADKHAGNVEGTFQEPSEVLASRRVITSAADSDSDGYTSSRKLSIGSQASMGPIRNDRTPLNTPYTPQLVKLHLTHQNSNTDTDQMQPFAPLQQLLLYARSKIALLIHPVRKLRKTVERLSIKLLPSTVLRSPFFRKYHDWILWYFTTVLCVPFALLLSPMMIAFCICTSPIWLAAIVVLFVRNLALLWNHHHVLRYGNYAHVESPTLRNQQSTQGRSGRVQYRRAQYPAATTVSYRQVANLNGCAKT